MDKKRIEDRISPLLALVLLTSLFAHGGAVDVADEDAIGLMSVQLLDQETGKVLWTGGWSEYGKVIPIAGGLYPGQKVFARASFYSSWDPPADAPATKKMLWALMEASIVPEDLNPYFSVFGGGKEIGSLERDCSTNANVRGVRFTLDGPGTFQLWSNPITVPEPGMADQTGNFGSMWRGYGNDYILVIHFLNDCWDERQRKAIPLVNYDKWYWIVTIKTEDEAREELTEVRAKYTPNKKDLPPDSKGDTIDVMTGKPLEDTEISISLGNAACPSWTYYDPSSATCASTFWYYVTPLFYIGGLLSVLVMGYSAGIEVALMYGAALGFVVILGGIIW